MAIVKYKVISTDDVEGVENKNHHPKCGRKEITATLTEAAIDYFTHKRFGVFKEIGVIRWGNLRADLFCVDLKGNFVGIEVKSCKADFDSDEKLGTYLQYFDKFYLCCPEYLVGYIREKLKDISDDIGIFTLGYEGYLYCAKQAHQLKGPLQGERMRLLLKLAWRGSDYNKRVRPRRKRRWFSE